MYSDNVSSGSGRGRGRGRGGSNYGGGGRSSGGGFDESRLGPTNDYNGGDSNSRNNHNTNNWNSSNNSRGRGGHGHRNNNNHSSNNFGNNSNQGSNQSQYPNPSAVEISNCSEGSTDSLVGFLKKQSSTRIEVLETRATENKIQVLLANIGQGRALVNLNKTYFSGRPIGIRLLPRDFALNWIGEFQQGGGGGPSNPSVDAWIKVMLPRYNPNAKLLDLSKLESEPLVIQHNLLGGRSFNKQICTVLIRIVSQQFPDIMSISFDNNYIEKLSDFGAMHKYLPNIQNLSFRNNRLMNIRDLEGLCTIGELPQLTELLLFDNPVRDLSIRKDGDDSTFRSNVSSMYPQLKQLDGGPCTPSIQFNLSVPGAANSKEFTPEILPSFYGSDMAMNTAAAFLSKFFVCLDSNRNSLYNVYDPSAFFSIDMSTFLFKPPKYPTGSKVKWGDYKSFNRNHTQPDISSSPSQRIAYGAQQILELLSKLPTTTHKVNDPSKVLVDSWMLPDLYPLGAGPGTRSGDYLYVVVHGEFTDSASGNLSRSFDRTFILKPALEGSPAMMDGWQVVIMSDSLTLRSYSNPKNFQPTPRESTPQPSTISSPQVAPSMPQSTPEQQNMLNVLHQKTGLNYQWTLNCLSSNNWNLEQAYQNFLQLQGSNGIPPEAYNK